jgi:2-polyprenyl-6-methoxyphenol hydroxylase-like FAD-dependent oxidoreductase
MDASEADTDQLIWGVSLTGLTQNENQVLVNFSDGSSGFYDLVVGADGIHSTVRELGVKHCEPSFAGMMVWRGLVEIRPKGNC